LGIKKAGKKETLIQRILLYSDDSLLENVDRRVKAFLGPPRTDKPSLHRFYKAKFSTIDRANQSENVGSTLGRVHNETGRMIRGLLKIPFTNVNTTIDYMAQQPKDFSDIAEAIYTGLIINNQFKRRSCPKSSKLPKSPKLKRGPGTKRRAQQLTKKTSSKRQRM